MLRNPFTKRASFLSISARLGLILVLLAGMFFVSTLRPVLAQGAIVIDDFTTDQPLLSAVGTGSTSSHPSRNQLHIFTYARPRLPISSSKSRPFRCAGGRLVFWEESNKT